VDLRDAGRKTFNGGITWGFPNPGDGCFTAVVVQDQAEEKGRPGLT